MPLRRWSTRNLYGVEAEVPRSSFNPAFPHGQNAETASVEPTRPVVSPSQPATSRQVDLEEVKSSVTPPEYWWVAM
jgi:hypothetical protein